MFSTVHEHKINIVVLYIKRDPNQVQGIWTFSLSRKELYSVEPLPCQNK